MLTDPVGQLLTSIRNAQRAGHLGVTLNHSILKEAIAKVLKDEGYIHSYETEDVSAGIKKIHLGLRYDVDGAPVVREIKRISKPGRRMFVRKDGIQKVKGGLGITILSTSSGVITGEQAKKLGVGGEILCSVF